MMELTIRNYRGDEDIRAITDLYNAAAVVDGPEYGQTEESMRQILSSPHVMPRENVFLFEVGEQLVAYGRTHLEEGDEESVFEMRGNVHPHWRRRGIGEEVVERVERRVRQRLGEARNRTVCISVGASLRFEDRQALFIKMGYKIVRYFFSMGHPLREGDVSLELPAPIYPANIVVQSMAERSDVRAVWQATDESFQDHWGHTETTLEQWQHWASDPQYRPELWLVAWDLEQDVVAGVCLNAIDPGRNERVGRQEGWIHTLAVRRPYRGQGLGRALLLEGMCVLQQKGMEVAMLGVDTDNLTGALRLYESVGFHPVKRSAAFRKVVQS